MVSRDRIQEEELTAEDVLDSELVQPQESVEMLPEWEEHPEERPGENVRIEDETLLWERDGFAVRLWNMEPTKWKAEIDVPEEYGGTWARPIDLKCRADPEHGFVESAEFEDYTLESVTLVISENFQPTYEVTSYIDGLIEDAEGFEEFQQDLDEKLEMARENED